MLAVERVKKIMEILNKKGFVSVEDLVKQFKVSDMTIRRDLEKCESAGLVVRCHGGAHLSGELIKESAFDEKKDVLSEEKDRIGKKCTDLVQDGYTIYLDSGTTTAAIVGHLTRFSDLTVITSDLQIALLLAKANIRSVILGGDIHGATYTVFGSLSEKVLDNFRMDIAFISPSCIDNDFNSFVSTIDRATLKQHAMSLSRRAYMTVDATKFYKRSLYKLAHLSEFSGVITDRVFGQEEELHLIKKKISIIPVV